MSVCQSFCPWVKGGDSHVTITQDLIVQDPTGPTPPSGLRISLYKDPLTSTDIWWSSLETCLNLCGGHAGGTHPNGMLSCSCIAASEPFGRVMNMLRVMNVNMTTSHSTGAQPFLLRMPAERDEHRYCIHYLKTYCTGAQISQDYCV